MKYARLCNRSAPDAALFTVQGWLEEELETRGIDSMVYARYVLSILLEEDDGDVENIHVNVSSNRKESGLHFSTKSPKDLKNHNLRSAVALLKSACDHEQQEVGIETLVEELQGKLKEAKMSAFERKSNPKTSDCAERSPEKASSPQEVAQKYFAAFPALALSDGSPKPLVERTTKRETKQKLLKKNWDGKHLIDVAKTQIREDDSSASSEESEAGIVDSQAQLFQSTSGNNYFQHSVVAPENGKQYGLCTLPEVQVDKELPSFHHVVDEDRWRNLASKFTTDVASIWKDDTGPTGLAVRKSSIWSYDSELSSPRSSTPTSPGMKKLWNMDSGIGASLRNSFNSNFGDQTSFPGKDNGDDCSSGWLEQSSWMAGKQSEDAKWSHAFPNTASSHNRTSLVNHNTKSLFVEVPANRFKSVSTSDVMSAFSINSLEQPVFENLLTSAQTHFQPIRQDYYEREVSIVIDPEVNGMVPCSSKCPNRVKIGAPKEEEEPPRPKSASQQELAQFIGPFPDDLETIITDSLECSGVDSCAEESESDAVTTETEQQNEPEPDRMTDASDYDALCCLLNNVLSEPITTGDETPTNVGWSTTKVQEIVAESLAVENRLCELQNKISREGNELLTNQSGGINVAVTKELPQKMYDFNLGAKPWKEFVPSFEPSETADLDSSSAFWLDDSATYDYKTTACGTEHVSEMPFHCDEGEDWQDMSANDLLDLDFKSRNEPFVQRPCSFFMEGNCRRSDCKFSHDLSRITCKFWTENSCFKGDNCPFLHGFDDELPQGTRISRRKPSFTIESEQDFPALDGKDDFPEDVVGSLASEKSSRGKRESQVVIRVVKTKRKKRGQQGLQ